MCVGVILAAIISIAQDKLASRWKLLPPTAEGRLYFSCVESALMPIGLFWFGWTSSPSMPYIVPALAVGCAAMGIFSIYLAVFNYLADTYHRYSSSAIAAQSCCKEHPRPCRDWTLFSVYVCVTCAHLVVTLSLCAGRNLLGGVFPLVTRQLFTNLGYPAASSLLGGIVSTSRFFFFFFLGGFNGGCGC